MPTERDYREIEELLDNLLAGGIGLDQVAPCLRAWYVAGFNEARSRYETRLRDAEYDRDRYYERLHNPGKQFTDMVQRRIDQAAIDHENEPDRVTFFTAVLDAATTPRKAA